MIMEKVENMYGYLVSHLACISVYDVRKIKHCIIFANAESFQKVKKIRPGLKYHTQDGGEGGTPLLSLILFNIFF